MIKNPNWAFIEIADMQDAPNPILPGYSDKEDGTPWTWQEWCDKPTKAATTRGGKIFIGAATFALRSQRLTAAEKTKLIKAGVVLIHPESLPPEDDLD
jgi:hypothetical protein